MTPGSQLLPRPPAASRHRQRVELAKEKTTRLRRRLGPVSLAVFAQAVLELAAEREVIDVRELMTELALAGGHRRPRLGRPRKEATP